MSSADACVITTEDACRTGAPKASPGSGSSSSPSHTPGHRLGRSVADRVGSIRPDRSLVPGVGLLVLATSAALVGGELVPAVSSLVVAVVLGAVIGNSRLASPATTPVLIFAGKRVLRVGIVLLGLRLSLGDVGALGLGPLAVVVATVAATFFGTQALGRRLGLSRDLALLVATGYSICGASAIAAVEGSTDAEDEEVAASIGLVTLFGTVAMIVLPSLAGVFDLSERAFGTWVGASIHDVAQVVAAGATGGAEVLAVAVVVKLTRVSLLAPVVAGVSLQRRRTAGSAERPPLLPVFVVGFLGMVLVRTVGVLDASALRIASTAEGVLLTAALVGLGSGVRLDALRRLGPTPLVLGALAWVVVATVSLGGVLVLG